MEGVVFIKIIRRVSKALFVTGWISLSLALLAMRPDIRTSSDEAELVGIEGYFEWLTENRVTKDKVLGSLLQAWEQAKKMPMSDSDEVWELLGPAPVLAGTTPLSGRTNSIAIDPTDPNILYIGAALGGVWKSTDRGETWTPLTDDQPSMAMGSVAIDPSNPQIIYAGTGEQNFAQDAYYGAGVLRSTDGGATWTQLGSKEFVLPAGGGATISRIVIDPDSPNTVYAASSFGLFKSTDRGDTWTLILSGRSQPGQILAAVTDLVIDPSNTKTLYAGLGLPASAINKGVYKSTDGGENWTPLDIGLTANNIGRINLAIAPSNPRILYAAIHNPVRNSDPPIFRLKSIDGGETWMRLPDCTGGACGQGFFNLVVAVHPRNPDVVYQGAVSLFRSTDGGRSWTTQAVGHPDYHGLTFDRLGNLYIANDGGVFRLSPDDELVSLNTNLALTQFYAGVALHPTNPYVIQAGSQDNGSSKTAGDITWQLVCGGDGMYQAIEGADGDPDNVWYCSAPRLSIVKTINNGRNLFRATNGLTEAGTGAAAFVAPFVMDPNNSRVLIAGTSQVWRTENGAANWVSNSQQFSTNNNVRSLAFAPTDSGTTYYAGMSNGSIWRTNDAGKTLWTRVSEGLPTNRIVTHIAAHPLDPNTVYATYSGFGGGHVFRSSNQGETWEDISSNLPNLPTNALLVDVYRSDAPTLYVGTDLGVFRSRDDGLSWERFSDGLPNTRVEDLVCHPKTGALVAATHGRGVWRLNAKSKE